MVSEPAPNSSGIASALGTINVDSNGLLGDRIRGSFLWTAFGRLTSQLMFFLLHLLLARQLSSADFGAYCLITALLAILSVLISLGLSPVVLRLLRERVVRQDLAACRRLIDLSFQLLALAAALCFLAAAAARYACPAELLPAVWWTIACATFAASNLVLGEIFRAFDQFRWATLIGGLNGGVIPNSLFLAVTLLHASDAQPSLNSILVIQVATSGCTFLLGLLVLSPTYAGFRRQPSLAGPPVRLATLTGQAFPLLLAILLTNLLQHQDLLILGFLQPATHELAVYGGVRRVVSFLNAPLLLANAALASFVAELHVQNQLPKLEKLLRNATTLALLPTVAVSIPLLLAPQAMLRLLLGSGFESASPVLITLVVANLVYVYTGSPGLVLSMTGNHTILLVATLAMVILALPSTLLASVRLNSFGTALAAAALTIGQSVALLLLVRQRLGVWTHSTASWPAVPGLPAPPQLPLAVGANIRTSQEIT